MKKKGFWSILKSVLLFVVPMVLKNQKGIKGTANVEIIDEVIEVIKPQL